MFSPAFYKKNFLLSANLRGFIEESRQTIKNILAGKDSRILLIMGPCSIHHAPSFLEYAGKMKEFSDSFSDAFFFVIRSFIEKPRTRAGWRGLLSDPHLDHSFDIESGMEISREILWELARLQLPAAVEFVDPLSSYFLDDLPSMVFVGARTVTSPVHRLMASRLACAVGFKNSLDGNVEHAMNAMQCAKGSHSFLGLDDEGKVALISSNGNPDGVVVLRGGESGPNYDCDHPSLERVIIDCSHGNSNKSLVRQKEIFRYVTEKMSQNQKICGVMLESYLQSGAQVHKPTGVNPHVSITDPCFDWETTQKLVENAYESVTPLVR